MKRVDSTIYIEPFSRANEFDQIFNFDKNQKNLSKVIYLKYAKADDVAKLLKKNFSGKKNANISRPTHE